MKWIRFILYYLLGIFGILFISVAPDALKKYGLFNPIAYLKELGVLLQKFTNHSEWVFMYKNRAKPVLEFLWGPFTYSITLIFLALFSALILAFLLSFLTQFLPKSIILVIKRILNILEAVPDVLVILLLQMLLVFIYKKTGTLLVEFTFLGEERVYLLPVITLMVLPMIMFYKLIVLLFEEELTKLYVDLAKSKGLRHMVIISKHVFRNIIKSVYYHSKLIMWGMLSSLWIIEKFYNIPGITYYLMMDFRPMIITIVLIMIFTPFFFIYQISDYFLTSDERASSVIKFKKHTPAIPMNVRFSFPMKDFMTSLIHFKWVLAIGKGFYQFFLLTIKGFFTHLKNWKFSLGFIFLLSCVLISIIYTNTADTLIKQETLLYSAQGKVIGKAPLPPSKSNFLLGSNDVGYSNLDLILVGAKYTIIFAVIIALLRILFGFLLAIPYVFLMKERGQKIIEKIADSLHFLPLSIVAYILLYPILWKMPDGWTYSFIERISYEVFILTILVVPLMTLLIGNEMRQIMKDDFVDSARILGGRPLHIIIKHLLPHLGPRLFITFGQQFVQVLFVFMHLGIFLLYFGGTSIKYQLSFTGAIVPADIFPYKYEWSGLLGGLRYDVMNGHEWIILPVLIGFMAIIIAMHFVVEGVKEVQQAKVGVYYKVRSKSRKRRKTHNLNSSKQILHKTEESFSFIHK